MKNKLKRRDLAQWNKQQNRFTPPSHNYHVPRSTGGQVTAMN